MNSTKRRGTALIADRRRRNPSVWELEGLDATARQRSRPAGVTRILPLLLLLILHTLAEAQFNYTVENGTVTITGYTGPDGDVVIPGRIDGLPVTSIGDYAFSGSTGLTSVVIPDSVTSIGGVAFYGCTGLTSITIPDSVTSIGSWAFSSCTGLTSITIPGSVTSIGYWAFAYCTGLTEITVGALNPLYSSLDGVLFNKSQTTLILCPEGKVGTYTIPDSVTSIGLRAFYGCTGLSNVTIPGNVSSIGEFAFQNCTGLTSVTIPDGVTSIERGTFMGCANLISVTIPDSVITIKGGTFVANLAGAFSGCISLTTIELPNSLTDIGSFAFSDCASLTAVTIPDSVTSIGSWAFSSCASLTSLTLGNGVTSIGYEAFRDCTGLTSVTIPDSVISIGDGAFYGCSGLTSVTIPDSVTSIGWSALSGCTGLTSVLIGNSVTSIGGQAFEGCTGLTSAYFEGRSPFSWGSLFDSCPAVIVYYRAGTTGWGATFHGRPTALWISPPNYSEWLPLTGLLSQYPNASAETDDPDQDGMSNHTEMLAGTDPTSRDSVLVVESVPRPADLTEADRTPLGAGQHAIYFRTVPNKLYGIQWNNSLDGPAEDSSWTYEGLWRTEAVVTATTTQTRFVFEKPEGKAFYRVILAQ
jgi:hypothetical protein